MVIELTKLTTQDLPFLIEVRNECRDMLHCNKEFNLRDAIKWFAGLPPEHYYLLIKSDGVAIGYFRIKEMLPFGIYARLEIGADLHKDFRGKGLAVAAYKLLFETYAEHVFELELLSFNLLAYNLYRKLGFMSASCPMEIEREGRLIPSIRMRKMP